MVDAGVASAWGGGFLGAMLAFGSMPKPSIPSTHQIRRSLVANHVNLVHDSIGSPPELAKVVPPIVPVCLLVVINHNSLNERETWNNARIFVPDAARARLRSTA